MAVQRVNDETICEGHYYDIKKPRQQESLNNGGYTYDMYLVYLFTLRYYSQKVFCRFLPEVE